MSENYLNEVIEELYEVLVRNLDSYDMWPINTTIDNKIRLLQGMIKYFESKDTIQDYKRCSKLKRYIEVMKVSDAMKIYKNNISGSKVLNN
jgi:hypothetical protein